MDSAAHLHRTPHPACTWSSEGSLTEDLCPELTGVKAVCRRLSACENNQLISHFVLSSSWMGEFPSFHLQFSKSPELSQCKVMRTGELDAWNPKYFCLTWKENPYRKRKEIHYQHILLKQRNKGFSSYKKKKSIWNKFPKPQKFSWKKKWMCGIWFNAKVTFLPLCYKEILGESHCCGRMRNEGMKQILPLRAIILSKLPGTSVSPEPWAGGGLQHPLITAVWQEPGLGACLLCPIQSILSKVSTGTGSGEHHQISLNLSSICMPRYLLSWERRAGSGTGQGTQCLSIWLHGLMTSGLDLSSTWHKNMAKKI